MATLIFLFLSCLVTATISFKCHTGTMKGSLAAPASDDLDCSKDKRYQDKCHVSFHQEGGDEGTWTFGCVGAFADLLCDTNQTQAGQKTQVCCCDTEKCNTPKLAQDCGLYTPPSISSSTGFNVLKSLMVVVVIAGALIIR